MRDFSLSKPLITRIKKNTAIPGNIAWTIFVAFCFWCGCQVVNLLINAPSIFEDLLQSSDICRPAVDMGFGVGMMFGVIVFAAGLFVLGILVIASRIQSRRSR